MSLVSKADVSGPAVADVLPPIHPPIHLFSHSSLSVCTNLKYKGASQKPHALLSPSAESTVSSTLHLLYTHTYVLTD